MAAVQKKKLSNSTDGRAILVATNATPGTSIHTAVSGTTVGTFDEIWLWAHNSSATGVALTVEFGGTTNPNDRVTVQCPPSGQGTQLVIPGWILQNGAIVRAFAGTANVVMVTGFVNAISA